MALHEKRMADKYIVNDHFLFPNLNATETAQAKVNFDKSCHANRSVAAMKANLQLKRSINCEGKAFAENLLKKAEQKVAK